MSAEWHLTGFGQFSFTWAV